MDKLNVSYYLSERLVSIIDERSIRRSGNRSRQVAEDLERFYAMIEMGLHSALAVLTSEEIRTVVRTLAEHPFPAQWMGVDAKTALMRIVGPEITTKIASLDDIACFALWDWARTDM